MKTHLVEVQAVGIDNRYSRTFKHTNESRRMNFITGFEISNKIKIAEQVDLQLFTYVLEF